MYIYKERNKERKKERKKEIHIRENYYIFNIIYII